MKRKNQWVLIWRSLKRQAVLIEEGVSLKVELLKLLLNWSVGVDYNTTESMNVIWRRHPKKVGVWIEVENSNNREFKSIMSLKWIITLW